MNTFSESQIQDLRDLQRAARDLGSEAVIIGAMAYRLFIEDADRQTYDIDLAVALDLDGFKQLEDALTVLEWRVQRTQEQRWITSRGNRLDLLPAGPSLLKERKVVWPRSGFVMSLSGFDHVFRDAAVQDVGGGLIYKVVPPRVLALLKIAAYLDNPVRRVKDLLDFRSLMRRYERNSERIFSDIVFDAELADIEFAGAFLLGFDVGAIATTEDRASVDLFLDRMISLQDPAAGAVSADDDWAAHDAVQFHMQLLSFSKGFNEKRI